MGLVTCFDSTTSGKTMLSVSDPTTTSSALWIVRNEKCPTILRHFVSMFAVCVEDGSPRTLRFDRDLPR